MKVLCYLLLIFAMGCKSTNEIQEIEMLTYFTNARDFKIYSNTGKNGFTQILFRSPKETADNCQTRINSALIDSISSVCRNKTQEDFVFKTTKKTWYCGNWKTVRITYENGEKLIFKFPYANRENKQFIPFESLGRQIMKDSSAATRLNIGQLDGVYTKQKSLSDFAFKDDSVFIQKILVKNH